MKRPCPSSIASIVLLTGLGGPAVQAAAGEAPADPDATRPVLRLLLGAANDPLPGSCGRDFGQHGPARVKDLLSMQLAYVYHGESVIRGSCTQGDRGRCTLRIERASGEDVSSLGVTFEARAGKVVTATMACTTTP